MAKVKTTSKAKKILSTFLTAVTKKSAEEIKREAKSLCPVDTGKLRRSITVQEIDKESYAIGSPLDYAIYVEMGTRYQTAQSFLRKAFYNVIQKKL